MPQTVEAEEFWKTLHPFLFPEDSFRQAEQEVDNLLALLDFKGRSVLDLACGPGRHATVLARKGYQVTGVDCSTVLLTRAKERAAAQGLTVEWIEEDMRNFVRPGAFDLVLSMFTSFGYFDDRRDDVKVLANVRESLAPGGVLLMELYGKEWMARNFQNAMVHEFGDDAALIESYEILDAWSRIRNNWRLIMGGRVQTFHFEHWLYSARELRDKLEQVGFEDIKCVGDWRGKPYGLHASRLIVIARK